MDAELTYTILGSTVIGGIVVTILSKIFNKTKSDIENALNWEKINDARERKLLSQIKGLEEKLDANHVLMLEYLERAKADAKTIQDWERSHDNLKARYEDIISEKDRQIAKLFDEVESNNQ